MGYLTLRRAEGPSQRIVPTFFSSLLYVLLVIDSVAGGIP
jgi:hypothetical protein